MDICRKRCPRNSCCEVSCIVKLFIATFGLLMSVCFRWEDGTTSILSDQDLADDSVDLPIESVRINNKKVQIKYDGERDYFDIEEDSIKPGTALARTVQRARERNRPQRMVGGCLPVNFKQRGCVDATSVPEAWSRMKFTGPTKPVLYQQKEAFCVVGALVNSRLFSAEEVQKMDVFGRERNGYVACEEIPLMLERCAPKFETRKVCVSLDMVLNENFDAVLVANVTLEYTDANGVQQTTNTHYITINGADKVIADCTRDKELPLVKESFDALGVIGFGASRQIVAAPQSNPNSKRSKRKAKMLRHQAKKFKQE